MVRGKVTSILTHDYFLYKLNIHIPFLFFFSNGIEKMPTPDGEAVRVDGSSSCYLLDSFEASSRENRATFRIDLWPTPLAMRTTTTFTRPSSPLMMLTILPRDHLNGGCCHPLSQYPRSDVGSTICTCVGDG